ncbi:MAG TPA: hypothetical protein VMD52_06615 [Patescibacteria group bacterium]|nr:hypothetical protein [Patescibacteria group bacterium]
MRDLVFKNLTSSDHKRRIVASSEVADRQGVRSTIHRHFVCMVKEVKDANIPKPNPYLYVLKQRNTKEQTEKFFCRIKGSLYAVNKGKLFLIIFTHSLKICLKPVPQDLMA